MEPIYDIPPGFRKGISFDYTDFQIKTDEPLSDRAEKKSNHYNCVELGLAYA